MLSNKKAAALFLAAAALAAAAGCASMQRWFAPSFRPVGPHENAREMSKADCFSCHRTGKDGAPIAPQSMYDKEECLSCHLKP